MLEKHLHSILKEANTIIIPGFGALTITNHTHGEIMFMPYLKYDDGKLTTYIAEKEIISIEDAKTAIANEVAKIEQSLENNRNVSFRGFGSFSKNSTGEIEFTTGNGAETESIINEIVEEKKVEITPSSTIQENPPIEVKETVNSDEITENKEVDKSEIVTEEITPKKKSLFSRFNKESVKPIESVEIETEKKVEIPEKSIELILENETPSIEVIVPESIVEKSIPVEKEIKIESPKQENSNTTENELVAEEIEQTETNVKPKKKRGFKFWFFLLLIFVILGGGAFVGLNYTKFKQYNPFIAKADKKDLTQEQIKKFESDKTKPSEVDSAKTEEIIDSLATPEAQEVIPETTVEQEVVTEPTPEPTPVSTAVPRKKTVTKKTFKSSKTIDSSKSFYIILGTFSEKINAEGYIERLTLKGTASPILLERDSKFSVLLDSYSTKEEAIAQLPNARSISKNAWVFHKE